MGHLATSQFNTWQHFFNPKFQTGPSAIKKKYISGLFSISIYKAISSVSSFSREKRKRKRLSALSFPPNSQNSFLSFRFVISDFKLREIFHISYFKFSFKKKYKKLGPIFFSQKLCFFFFFCDFVL